MTAQAALLRLAGAALAMLVCFVLGMNVGDDAATARTQAKAAASALAAAQTYRQQVERGDAAVTTLTEQLRAQDAYVQTLDERLRSGQVLTVVRACGTAAPQRGGADRAAGGGAGGPVGRGIDAGRVGLVPGPAGAAGGAGAAAPGAAAGAAVQDAAAEPGPVAADVLLTAGAVSLWDSALAGADVPAGACGAADPASPACAAATGYSLADAWRNHATNAARCAEDRARHQGLIDYLKARAP